MSWLLVFTALGGGLIWLAELIGALYYDWRTAQAERAQAQHPHARTYRRRPLVSVVIVTDGAPVDACLQTVWASAYRKLEVIVVANGPVDATSLRQTLRGRGRLVVKRQPTDRTAAILSTRRYLHGELVLLLEPSVRLQRQTITAAVCHLNREPTITWLLPDVQPMAHTVSGLFQSYVSLLSRRAYKFRQVVNLTLPFINSPAVFCYTPQLGRQLRRSDQLGVYGSEVHMTTTGPASFYMWWQQQYAAQRRGWQMLTQRDWRQAVGATVALLAGVLLPLCAGYAIYLAVNLQQTWLLGLGVLAWMIILLSAIGDNQQLSLRRKLGYMLGLPIAVGFGALALVTNVLNDVILMIESVPQHQK